MTDLRVCPICDSQTTTYRHPFAKVWRPKCGHVLREEGSGKPSIQQDIKRREKEVIDDMIDCTLATVEAMIGRKSTPKEGEFKRQCMIAQKGIDFLGKEFPYKSRANYFATKETAFEYYSRKHNEALVNKIKGIEMKKVRVVAVDAESLTFDNGAVLSSYHDSDCCERHYLSLKDLDLSDFEGLEFDISGDDFFERIEGYGIELKPLYGFPVRIPGYGSNNGSYSSNLSLMLKGDRANRKYDITECQVIN